MIKTIRRARDTIKSLDLIEMALQAGTVLLLIVAIAAAQVDRPNAFFILGPPALAIAIWAGSGLFIDREALRGERRT